MDSSWEYDFLVNSPDPWQVKAMQNAEQYSNSEVVLNKNIHHFVNVSSILMAGINK